MDKNEAVLSDDAELAACEMEIPKKNRILELASSKGYKTFTPLQDKVFSDSRAFASGQNLFVIGETSSGKTLIALLLYLLCYKMEVRMNHKPRMLFVVPYRALAAQKLKEFRQFYKDEKLEIQQSTGEYRNSDGMIINGNVDIAIVIVEKAFIFSANYPDFLTLYDFIVIDEIGLAADVDRGTKVDFFLSMAYNTQKNCGMEQRMIALGTPFYDWHAYIGNYGFLAVKETTRPIKLKECPIFFMHGILNNNGDGPCPLPARYRVCKERNLAPSDGTWVTTNKCYLLGDELCPNNTPCRRSETSVCIRTQRVCPYQIDFCPPCIPYKTILIARICRFHLKQGHQILIFWNNREEVRRLCADLYELLKDVLPQPPGLDVCKERLLSDCGLSEDEVHGILDSKHYLAFAAGIGFHSSAVPNGLRSYVEDRALNRREMKIVCSTETLAYGINSAVDVVMIPDMTKPVNGGQEFLTANEYCNYKGRAGRMGYKSESDYGYVYPIIRSRHDHENIDADENQWIRLQEQCSVAQSQYSHIFDRENTTLPFFLITVISAGENSGKTVDELIDLVRTIPHAPDVFSKNIGISVQHAMEFLLSNHMVSKHRIKLNTVHYRNSASAAPTYRNEYILTAMGRSMCGFVISMKDFNIIIRAIQCCCNKIPIQKESLIESLLDTKLVSLDILNSKMKKDQVFEALKLWCRSTSQRRLHEECGATYPLIENITSSISFLLEIAQRCTYAISFTNLTLPEKEKIRGEISRQIEELRFSVLYGIDYRLYEKFYLFLKEKADLGNGDRELCEMVKKYSEDALEPEAVTRLRRYSIALIALKTAAKHSDTSGVKSILGNISKYGTVWVSYAKLFVLGEVRR